MEKTFEQIGLDRTLPFIAVVMETDNAAAHPPCALPAGFSFAWFTPGREEDWVALQLSVEHVDTADEGRDIFRREFLLDCAGPDDLRTFSRPEQYPGYEKLCRRMLFVLDPDGRPAGTGALWTGATFGRVRQRLHWIAVSPAYQGRGLSKAIVARLLELCTELGEQDAYLTTQTWSYKAAGVYKKMGFHPYIGEKPAEWPFACALNLPDFAAENAAAWAIINEKLDAFQTRSQAR